MYNSDALFLQILLHLKLLWEFPLWRNGTGDVSAAPGHRLDPWPSTVGDRTQKRKTNNKNTWIDPEGIMISKIRQTWGKTNN